MERPLTLIAEQVEHRLARRAGFGGPAILAVVEEQSGLLPAGEVHLDLEAILAHGDGLRHLAPPDLSLERQALELAQRGVRQAHHAARRNHALQRLLY